MQPTPMKPAVTDPPPPPSPSPSPSWYRGGVSFVVGIVVAVATAALSATVKNNSTDALPVGSSE